MAGVDFDRQAFIPAAQPAARPAPRLLVPLILMIGVATLGFIGYKLFSQYSQNSPTANSQGLQQIQEQLAGMEKRLDQLEKHRKVPVAETPANAAPAIQSQHASGNPSPKRQVYRITSGSALDPQPKKSRPPEPIIQSPANQPRFTSSDETAVANHEAWQATTNRLADVVGVVGSQQGEISQAREDINRLLGEYIRALVFLSLSSFIGYGLFLSLTGASYFLLLAGIAAICEFLPVVGPAAAGIVVLLVTGLSGYEHLVWFLIFWLVFRLFQDYVVSPYLMGKGVEMNPMLVLFGVLAGEKIAGVTGMFFSIPVLAILRVIFVRLRRVRHDYVEV